MALGWTNMDSNWINGLVLLEESMQKYMSELGSDITSKNLNLSSALIAQGATYDNYQVHSKCPDL